MSDIFHSGELNVQRMAGEVIMANSNGRIINNALVSGAISFIEKQPMVVLGSIDDLGNVWASLVIGDFGFVKVENPKTLIFYKDIIHSNKNDIFYKNIVKNYNIGSLFIELSTRRRFRINGIITNNNNTLKVNVEEAYPNCPKYIQQRAISISDHFKKLEPKHTEGNQLGDDQKDCIINADTIFISSTSNKGKMDVSHRGGNLGFIEILKNNTLKIPDYKGNSMFNTLGNFVENPNSGMLLVNFDKGSTLQLTGKSELLFNQESPDDIGKTTGTGRYWLFKTDKWIYTENHHSVDWELLDYSPFNP